MATALQAHCSARSCATFYWAVPQLLFGVSLQVAPRLVALLGTCLVRDTP